MKLGVYFFPTDETMHPVDLAKAVEDIGLESLWLPEHTHIPTSRRSPYPFGDELPREYTRTFDPLVTLAAAASATERLLLATGVCLVVERDPIVLAKEIATLDHLCGGRLLFGVGAGWNLEEMADHGTDPARRFAVLRERVLAMKEIWAHDEPSFKGEFVDFDAMWSWPKPLQRPHPPVILGGAGPAVIERVVEYADGWMPIAGPADATLGDRIDALRERAAAAGRGPMSVSVYAASSRPEALERYEAQGVDRCILRVPPAGADEILPRLARYAETGRRLDLLGA